MKKKKKSSLDTDLPDYIIDIGKCKSYLGNFENNKLFFMSLKSVKPKKIAFLLNSIEFSIKKLNNALLTVKSIYDCLSQKEDRKIFLNIILHDAYLNDLKNEDIDFIKEKLNGEFINDKELKGKEYILFIIKKKRNDKIIIKNNHIIKTNSFISLKKNFTFDIYLKEVQNILRNKEKSIKKDMQNKIEIFLAQKNIDYEKVIYSTSLATEKIKEYKEFQEMIKDAENHNNINIKCIKIAKITPFFKHLRVENFKEKLPDIIPNFRKEIISSLLYEGFRFNFENSILLMGEIEYYLRIMNGIQLKKEIPFKAINIANPLAKELMENFNVRNLLSHGIIDEQKIRMDSFIVYLIALEILYNSFI